MCEQTPHTFIHLFSIEIMDMDKVSEYEPKVQIKTLHRNFLCLNGKWVEILKWHMKTKIIESWIDERYEDNCLEDEMHYTCFMIVSIDSLVD